MRLTDKEFEVCAKILRAKDGPLRNAVRLVMVDLRSSGYALHANPSLTKQQLSNALSRYEKQHKLILTGYDRRPVDTPDGEFWV